MNNSEVALAVYCIFKSGYYSAAANYYTNKLWDSIPVIDTFSIANDRSEKYSKLGVRYCTCCSINSIKFCNSISYDIELSDSDIDEINFELSELIKEKVLVLNTNQELIDYFDR